MELGPEDEDRDRRLVADDAVAECMELIGIGIVDTQCGGSPIIQLTNCGARRIPPIPVGSPEVDDSPDAFEGVSSPRTATSVNVAPAFLPELSVQLPAVPDALQSVAVGVGSIPRAASLLIASGNVGPSLPGRSGIDLDPFVASLARGVGSLDNRSVSDASEWPRNDIPIAPRLASLAVGVGSLPLLRSRRTLS